MCVDCIKGRVSRSNGTDPPARLCQVACDYAADAVVVGAGLFGLALSAVDCVPALTTPRTAASSDVTVHDHLLVTHMQITDKNRT